MDIFTPAYDDLLMNDRREILKRAAVAGGFVLAAPLVAVAAPYVRLDAEADTLSGELDRYQREVENLYALLERRKPSDTRTLIWATWANLGGVREHALPEVRLLKARLALLGGVNAVTLRDSNGSGWFKKSLAYSMMAKNIDLYSLAHARRALAGLYWGETPRSLLRYSGYAIANAKALQAKGVANMAHARVLAADRRPGEALAHAQWSLERAESDTGYPRVDDWQAPLALLMATRALSGYPDMAVTVEYYGQTALASVPMDALHFRTNINLDLALSRIHKGELEEAARPLNLAIGDFMAPVHVDRAFEVLKAVRAKDRNAIEIRKVRSRLEAIAAIRS